MRTIVSRAVPATRWVLMLSALLTACAAPAPQGEPTGERRVQYRCSQGETVEVRYFPLQGVAVLVRQGKPMELQQQPVASGFLYSSGPHAVRGKGDDIQIEVGRMVPLACKAL